MIFLVIKFVGQFVSLDFHKLPPPLMLEGQEAWKLES
jgi:hypothetical protein